MGHHKYIRVIREIIQILLMMGDLDIRKVHAITQFLKYSRLPHLLGSKPSLKSKYFNFLIAIADLITIIP